MEPGENALGHRFELCFRAHHAEVLAYALRRLDDRARADDVAAETFAIAWRRRDALPADPIPWLIGIARNVIRNQHRSGRRRARLHARLIDEAATGRTRDPADALAERTAILTALEQLGEREREVLRLVAWEGLDGRRAAAALGCSRGAYAIRLHRARRRLAKALAVAGHDPVDSEPPLLRAAEEEAR
jgi:RNA polymerase sigma-70 factor (ECF subfamily)